jgi:hypothetical protein
MAQFKFSSPGEQEEQKEQEEEPEEDLQKKGSWASSTTEIVWRRDMLTDTAGKTEITQPVRVADDGELVQPRKDRETGGGGPFLGGKYPFLKRGKPEDPGSGKGLPAPLKTGAKFNPEAASPAALREIPGKTQIPGGVAKFYLYGKVPLGLPLPRRADPEETAGKGRIFFKHIPVVFLYFPKRKNPQGVPDHHIDKIDVVLPGYADGFRIAGRFRKVLLPLRLFRLFGPLVIQQFLDDKNPVKVRGNINAAVIGDQGQLLGS